MICFAWWGFPQYAARCIGAFVKGASERVVVLATRPAVPIEGMEDLCKCQVIWVEENDQRSITDLVGEIPKVIFTSGWCIPAFNRYCDEVRRDNGLVFAMVDNNYVPSIKETLRALRFRLFLCNKFNGFLVPGNSGVRLLKAYGVDEKLIVKGMYSADGSIFKNGLSLCRRDKKIIYVGQFIERKNVRRMVMAFAKANESVGGDWILDLYGCGSLQGELERMGTQGVKIHAFVQPEQLAGLYREARIFCLPSIEEHWGLVVHEAALSGCVLLLSNKVGAGEDLLGASNGFSFDPKSESEMIVAFRKAMSMSEDSLTKAHQESLALAKTVSIDRFVIGINALLSMR